MRNSLSCRMLRTTCQVLVILLYIQSLAVLLPDIVDGMKLIRNCGNRCGNNCSILKNTLRVEAIVN